MDTAAITSMANTITKFDYMSLIPFIGVVVLSFIIAKITYFLIQNVAKRLVGQTKTILDDLLLEAIEGPITYGIVIVGLYIGAMMSSLAAIPIVISVFQTLVLIWLSVTAYRVACAFIHWYVVEVAPRHKLALHDIEPLIKRVVGVVIFILAALTILGTAGIKVEPLIASLGIAGLAVALALQDTLGNFFGGVSISVDRPLRHGDFVELSEFKLSGWVEKIGWRSTQIRTPQNNYIVIPNSKLAQSVIINYHLPNNETAVIVPVSVSYDSDLEHVEKATLLVADKLQKMPGAVQGFKPLIRYGQFGESSINFNVILRATEYTESGLLAHQFIKELHAAYKKEGIEMPYPKRSVYIEHMPDGMKGAPKGKKAK